jgi:hypothetical protein
MRIYLIPVRAIRIMPRKLMSLFDFSRATSDMLFGWSNVTLIIGAALVLIGTIGVIWTGGIRQRYADERISENEAKTAQAVSDASKANVRTAEFEVKTKEAQLNLERERVARLKLEAKLKPRGINQEDRQKLLIELRHAPNGCVFVVPKVFDEEAEDYAAQIASALKDAGYTIEQWKGARPFSFGRSGAFIWVKDISKPPPHAAAIQHAFKEIGVTLDEYGDANIVLDNDVIIVGVGAKP